MTNRRNEEPLQIEALLIDLDGTLLHIDMEQFLPAYIPLLASRFDGTVTLEQFADHLLRATEVTIETRDTTRTNEEVFYDDFCRRLGLSKSEVYPVIERFYTEDFHRLSRYGKPYPNTSQVVATARSQNLKLVLATQPIFPLVAVEERLSWCGLAGSDFDLITTAENMHSCKPHPEYYREIASKIDCLPGRCLMAGNDMQEDISAAGIGMLTFLVEGFIIDRGGNAHPADYRGSLGDLAELIGNGFSAPRHE